MLNMSVKRKIQIKKERNKISKNRLISIKKDLPTQDSQEKKRFLNTQRHNYEMAAKGNYELLYPLVRKSGEIVPDIGDSYFKRCISRSSVNSNSIDNFIKEELKTFQNEKSPLNDTEAAEKEAEKNLTDEEKLAQKYKSFAKDAFQAWDGLMSGCYRTRTRFLLPEDSSMRVSNKAGFGSSAKRLDLSNLSKQNYIKANIRNKRATFQQSQRQINNSSCALFSKTSMSITTDQSSRRTSQGDLKNASQTSGCLPIISEGKFKVSTLKVQSPSSRIPQSNKNSLPKLPKVL